MGIVRALKTYEYRECDTSSWDKNFRNRDLEEYGLRGLREYYESTGVLREYYESLREYGLRDLRGVLSRSDDSVLFH